MYSAIGVFHINLPCETDIIYSKYVFWWVINVYKLLWTEEKNLVQKPTLFLNMSKMDKCLVRPIPGFFLIMCLYECLVKMFSAMCSYKNECKQISASNTFRQTRLF